MPCCSIEVVPFLGQVVENPSKLHFSWEKNPIVRAICHCLKLAEHEPLTPKLSHYRKSGSTSYQNEPVGDYHSETEMPSVWLRNAQCVCFPFTLRPTPPTQWSSAINFRSQNIPLSSGIALGSNCRMTGRGADLDSTLNSAV